MSHNHYFRDVSGLERIDVYRLLDLFGVTCPVAQHVVKKAIAAGQRGHKTTRRDWQDIADSAARKLEMIDEDNGWTDSAIKAAAFPQQWPDEARRQDAAAEDEAFAAIEASQERYGAGWVEWRGESVDAPCHGEAWIDVELRDGAIDKGRACGFRWEHRGDDGDIVAWRPHLEASQYTGQGGVMIRCPGCTATSCECRP